MSGVGSPAFLPPAAFVRSPQALGRSWSPAEGRAYTRWLATHHYENFHVVSFLLPKRLHARRQIARDLLRMAGHQHASQSRQAARFDRFPKELRLLRRARPWGEENGSGA